MACSAANLWRLLAPLIWLDVLHPWGNGSMRAQGDHTTGPNQGPEGDGTRRALRILVVDDLTDAADSLAMLLTRHGHRVRTAYDGPAAITTAAEFAPHVILLDIALPKLDGYRVAVQLRQQTMQRPCLIAVTGLGQTDDVAAARAAGFDHHFLKPVNPGHLLSLLNSLS